MRCSTVLAIPASGKRDYRESLLSLAIPRSIFLFQMVSGHAIHLVLRAEEHRNALVEALRLDVEDALVAVRRGAARLLDDERHRVCLVHQAQLARTIRRALVGGIHEDAA